MYRPEAILSEEEKKRFVHVGQPPAGVDGKGHTERRVIPTPDWNTESVYHSTPPRALRVVVHPSEAPVDVHWTLDEVQLDRLKAMIREPYPYDLSSEAQGILKDFTAIDRNSLVDIYASVFPLTPAHVQMPSLSQTYQSSGTLISWRGPRGFMDEKLQIGRRKNEAEDRSWYEVDGPARTYCSDDDDDDFFPEFSWPAAQGISKEDVLANWESILDDITLLTEVPLFPERIILNRNETMIGMEKKRS
ncbi:hypothetical protein BDN72DRAFT_333847 [Pluteus cervinus]|uniref:Uncharacterized protein n=1 Tax=Pluteus cervinus TaxID=181527 RepID=A0ACD3B3E2_9AGAR|nr:hypothetical protein BDN72DRAFT_333847 [Pluteus cervinus]